MTAEPVRARDGGRARRGPGPTAPSTRARPRAEAARASDPVLVGPRPGEVPDPLHRPVVALLLHLQESHAQAAGRELRHVEVHRYRRLHPLLVGEARRQLHLCQASVLVPSGESPDSPDDRALRGLKSSASVVDLLDVPPRCVPGAREVDLDIRCGDVAVVHRGDLQAQLQAVAPQHLDAGQQLEWTFDVLRDPVCHQLKHAIRGDECDLSVHVEL
mmetsp:Transcript_96706/g.270679  ORF Transcript_96706/g.270679 Transcript_96706/m.270679 type:complete len:216 (+) Transcript_96706:111-758(+)